MSDASNPIPLKTYHVMVQRTVLEEEEFEVEAVSEDDAQEKALELAELSMCEDGDFEVMSIEEESEDDERALNKAYAEAAAKSD